MFLESEELGTNGEDRPQYDFLQQLPGDRIIVLYIIVTCQLNRPCFHDLWSGAVAEAEQERRGVTQVPTQTLSMLISPRHFEMPKMCSFYLINTHSKENYFLGTRIWYLYSILKARWSFLRVTDEYKQYMISGSKKAPQIGRARSRANSLPQLFDSIALTWCVRLLLNDILRST